jgi:hypothetical protein
MAYLQQKHRGSKLHRLKCTFKNQQELLYKPSESVDEVCFILADLIAATSDFCTDVRYV